MVFDILGIVMAIGYCSECFDEFGVLDLETGDEIIPCDCELFSCMNECWFRSICVIGMPDEVGNFCIFG